MNYQSSSDSEDPRNTPMRPRDAAMSGGGQMQEAGADEVTELGSSPIKPPFSNPSSGELQMGGADCVEEIGGSKSPTWPWANQAGNTTKPL